MARNQWSRRVDREAVAARCKSLAAELGIEATISTNQYAPRCLYVRLCRPGLTCGFRLDGTGRTDALVISWNSDERLPEDFGRNALADVNQYHGRKATTVSYFLGGALSAIKGGFEFFAEVA